MSQSRVILENISPEIDGGRFQVKRVLGDHLEVEVDLYGDGHDVVNGHLLYRHASQRRWRSVQLEHQSNDRWSASFELEQQGVYKYKVKGWVDYALNWQHEIERKIEDGQQVGVELVDGVKHLERIHKALKGGEKAQVKKWIALFQDAEKCAEAEKVAISDALHAHFLAFPSQDFAIETTPHEVYVDRKKAEFSTWYELFPRSASQKVGKHGTFKDVEKLLPRIAEMGFDVLYMPPIHPIGRSFRKGKNNSVTAQPGEPGSCWGVGAAEGGHTAILPELGTLEDFQQLVVAAEKKGIEIAMDIAFQCAPDHPWVKEHPAWFKWRSDGSVQYAENPPKKYQDILPIHFESPDWKNLWKALTDVVLYWMDQGVTIFRIDNPHTKPFRFWEHLIAAAKKKNPDALFLSEAFTRPKIMHQLAKVGFSQSYTYYTWRMSKQELTDYLVELTEGPGRDYFRPNFWPNTPDINPWQLQSGHEATYIVRYAMAATLNSNVGIYGPVYEYMVHEAVPGKEEYWDSEKYEIRHWNWEKRNKLTHVITKVNQARKDNPALQTLHNISFCALENDQLLAWFKQTGDNSLLMVANLDPYHTQSGWVQVPLAKIGLREGDEFRVNDLVTGNTYLWNKEWNYVELNPHVMPFHLFKIETN